MKTGHQLQPGDLRIMGQAIQAHIQYSGNTRSAARPVKQGHSSERQGKPGLRADIPIIALTAHDSSRGRERCLSAGMSACPAKPSNPNCCSTTRYVMPTELSMMQGLTRMCSHV